MQISQTTTKVARFYYVISIAIFVFFLHACTKSSTCLTPKVVALRGSFYYRDTTGNFLDTSLVNANLYFGAANNYVQNLKQRKQFNLPLAQNTDSIMLFFQSDSNSIEPETIDSIKVIYTREPHFISTACGYETFFDISKVDYTTHVIDTLLVGVNAVNNDVNKENLKIVLKK
jgi:hypothetical protein